MLAKIISLSLENRFLVLVATGLMAIAGVLAALNLPIDAVPDLTNVQVQVLTNAGSLSPVEVETYVTYPIERSLSGLPKLQELRSISRLGISLVTVVFEEGTDLYWARQLVSERLSATRVSLGDQVGQPELGPLSTALGEILQFEVKGKGYSPTELRTLLEWDIAPKLREVQGITEVNSHGGLFKTYEIRPNPDRMLAQGVSIAELAKAIEENNLTAGGGYAIAGDQQRFIQGQARLKSLEDIGAIVLRSNGESTPLLVRDVADVGYGSLIRQGMVTRDGRGEAVVGMTMMLVGENSRTVVQGVKARIEAIQKTLPPGVEIEIIYDRSELIGRTLATVIRNLVEGGALVILVLLFMLGSVRAGIITALAIPLSMLFATSIMWGVGISASLMSLGAIDFGLIVDSSVIMIENCLHRMGTAKPGQSRREIIRDAAIEVRKPTMFGELIIAVVYLPILMLEGSEGKLFRPMALTVLFALGGSLILSMTLMPALASLFLPKKVAEHDLLLIRWLKAIYRPILHRVVPHPYWVAMVSLLFVAVSLPIATRLGGEFMPKLNEGDLLVEVNRLPSATLESAITISTQVEMIIKRLPEVKTVFCKTGRPEIANDIMGVQQTDVWVMLHPREKWRSHVTRDDLKKTIQESLRSEIPGATFGITQPIEMRVDELVAGVKADVAVLIYGDDMEILQRLAKEIERILKGIRGAEGVKADYQANLTTLRIDVDRQAIARAGLSASQVMSLVSSLGQMEVGTIFEGKARFPIIVRMPDGWREDLDRVGQLPVLTANGQSIPLRDLAKLQLLETPPAVEHEWNRRRTFVQANIEESERDVASFVSEAQRRVQEEVVFPPGYEVRWGGDFENLQSASLRLMIITPIVLLLIALLLHSTFRSVKLASLIFLAVPVAASGGIFALSLRGIPFSISAGVGFIALFGVAVLNGLVWVSAAEQLRLQGMAMKEVVIQTGLSRLRPILMTALVAGLGFLPMALSHGDGAEIQRPLATVVIGGLLTSTLLTTLVLPCIYPWFSPRESQGIEA